MSAARPVPVRRQLVANFARGLLMGAADVIPGVSGGTVALIVGIYERLIRSIRLGASGLLSLARLDMPGARLRFAEVEWRLVLPLGAGIASAIVVGAGIIPPLLEHHREPVSALFFGLILGSIVIPLRSLERIGAMELLLMAGFAVVAFLIVGLPPREMAAPSLLFVFGSAAIAICAMILPGVSGAFVLLVLGIYRPTLEALTGLNLPYIGAFMAGAVLGLGTFAKVLEWLLLHRHAATMAALVGLMSGSIRALWPWQTEERVVLAPPDLLTLAAMGGLAALGIVAVLLLLRVSSGMRAAGAKG